jgi:uncharacterized phage protein gp47/JayE
MSEIVIPDYLNESADTVHARMLEMAPDGVTTIEGDIYWDCTRPTAEEKSKLEKIQLQNIIKQSHPQTATGIYLEYFGEFKGVYKNAATYSTGNIQITGTVGREIEAGRLFGTPSTASKQSIQFEILENVTIDSDGNATLEAQCTAAGVIGNVEPNTITILISKIDGIKSVTNSYKFTGGTDIEDEEHYRARVMAAEQEENLSGADSDYVKWALEVDGVGSAYPLEEWNGASTVKVLILDKNGQPATQTLIKAVKDYIYPDKVPGQNRGGKAPVGAVVTIDTPSTLSINIKAKYTFTSGFDPQTVLNNLKADISPYLKQIKMNGIVNYNAIHGVVSSYILDSKGIDDFTSLTINNVAANITLINQVPVIGEVVNVT